MMEKSIATFVLKSKRLYDCWTLFSRKSDSFFECKTRLFKCYPHRFTSFRQYASARNLPIPENSIKKFLNHLVEAHTQGTITEFEAFLRHHSVKALLNERATLLDNIDNLTELENDPEMKKLAEEEKLTNNDRLAQVDSSLIELILNNLAIENYDNVIIEISAGVGGQESMLFVKDLMEMYLKHLSYLEYSFDVIEMDESLNGGLRHASIMVSGKGCFEKIRHEAGVHRVQRVPATERTGRMHTSVVSVSVLPQPSEIDIVIDSKDLRIDVMRASGAGGQHVNTTNSAVRVTHLPTGTVAECQTNRSQIKNRELALAKLRARLYDTQFSRQMKEMSSLRKEQKGLGLRHEKIRTYNYSQGRVTDHRIPNSSIHNLEEFLEGGRYLNELHNKLSQDSRCKIIINSLKYL